MFDGENKPILMYLRQFMNFIDSLTGDKQDYLNLFKLKMKSWSKKRFRKFRKHYSVFSKKLTRDPLFKKSKRTKLDIEFKSNQVKTSIKRKHRINNVEMETLDDHMDQLILYRIVEFPVDISKFIIIFDAHGGIDLFKDSKKVNLNYSKDHIIALVHSGGIDPKKLNEIIDKNVAKILKATKITDLSGFLIDNRVTFIKFGKKNVLMAKFKKSLNKPKKRWSDLIRSRRNGLIFGYF